jgi:hypothetical protein
VEESETHAHDQGASADNGADVRGHDWQVQGIDHNL